MSKKYGAHPLLLNVDLDLLDQVDRYTAAHGFGSRSNAILFLLKHGIRHQPRPGDMDLRITRTRLLTHTQAIANV